MEADKMKIIDLSREITTGLQVYKGDPEVSLDCALSVKNGDPCSLTAISMGSHTATHCDAFSHFLADGVTVDKLPLEHFFGRAAVLDIEVMDGLISVQKLREQLSDVRDVNILLLRTGHEKLCGTPEYFSFVPAFDQPVSGVLAEKGIITIGVDFPSVEGTDGPRPAHLDLLSASIAIVEGLVNMDKLTEKYFTFCAMPLKLSGCDGSPVRAAAIL